MLRDQFVPLTYAGQHGTLPAKSQCRVLPRSAAKTQQAGHSDPPLAISKATNSIAGEVAGDFMFWPAHKHRFGWFLEPAYDYSFARGHHQSFGLGGGLLFAFF